MKKLYGLILLVSISLFGCVNEENVSQVQSEEHQNQEETNENIEELVLSLVEKFGYRLQEVSLLGPQMELEKNMKEKYGDIVSPELIDQWLKDPLKAPGRLTSSPWPDRIDVTNIERLSDNKYAVTGEIVEVTSTNEIANRKPIQLMVEEVEKRWFITDVKIEQSENDNHIVYINNEYSFQFTLPISWKGYSIIEDEWEGEANGEVIENGPKLSIRHPEWTAENPRQDIPILIFTVEQWNLLQNGKFHIGAAPIGPKELGRNEKYVFALPARYNFAFPIGYEEVEEIVESEPLEPSI